MHSLFRFKQFTIQQKRAAMKVGTDSILLGSWVRVNPKVDTILDIGAGTGILSLMLAQRCQATAIDAVEIDPDAYEEAVTNFENSPWGDRLFCYHTSIQEFAAEVSEKYDLIIVNPPYYNPSKIQEATQRDIARQTHLLNHITLLKSVKTLLKKQGSCAFVIPFDLESFFVDLARTQSLFPVKITRVKDTKASDYKRVLLQFSFNNSSVIENELFLKNNDKSYSDDFVKLTQSFYLKF